MPPPSSAARARAAPTLPSGTRIGQYEVLDRIAVGGMAELYLARRIGIEGFEKRVALKRVLPQLVHDAEFTSMFLDEARLAARLDHPNVVQVIDIGVVDDEFFFVMEYLHGKNLRKVLREACHKNVAPLDFAINVVIRMAAGLHHAHEAKDVEGDHLELVHRDVSPQNVLITYDGNVKLVDFGIAKAAAKRANTQTGTLKGKLGYMAPEQYKGLPIDRRADLFALGVVLYELTVGRRPFTGDNQFAIIGAANEGRFDRPTQLNPDYPPQLEAIVEKLVVADPDQRYPDAETVLNDLEDVAAQLGIRVSPSVTRNFMRTHFEPPDIISGPIRAESEEAARSLSSHRTAALSPDEIATSASVQIPVRRSGLFAILGVTAAVLIAGGISLGVWLSRSGPDDTTNATAPAAAVGPASEDIDDGSNSDEPSVEPEAVPVPVPEVVEVVEFVDVDEPDSDEAAQDDPVAKPKPTHRRKKRRKKKPKDSSSSSKSSPLFPPSYK